MRCYCAHCLQPFETPREREFCTPEHLAAYHAADELNRRLIRDAMRNKIDRRAGMRPIAGGYQAINFGLSDRISQ